MRSGSLIHLISFQQDFETSDDFGAPIKTARILVPNEWAQIIPLKGTEKYVSKHLKAEVNHKIRMRYRAGLDSSMKVIYESRVFEIDSIINPYEKNRTLEIMVTEVV